MKAMMLTGIRKMKLFDVPEPKISSGTDVKVRMSVVGVCGSDIHYYTTGRIGDQVVKYPFTVGHEGAGVVEEVGPDVRNLRPGDLVAVDPAMPCFECDQCMAGRHHTCRRLKFLGCPGQAEGCLSEFIVMPETSCFRVTGKMTADDAAISEPLAIGVYAVKRALPVKGLKIGILGSGPIGMSVMLAARVQGPEAIYMTDRINARLELMKQAGSDWTGNPDEEDIVTTVNELEPAGLDLVFECCGKQEALDQAFTLLKPGGRIMIVGIPEFDTWKVPVSLSRRKEITVYNIRRQVDCVEQTLGYLASGQINGSQMITHRFGLEDASKAFDLVAGYRDGVMKAMIDF